MLQLFRRLFGRRPTTTPALDPVEIDSCAEAVRQSFLPYRLGQALPHRNLAPEKPRSRPELAAALAQMRASGEVVYSDPLADDTAVRLLFRRPQPETVDDLGNAATALVEFRHRTLEYLTGRGVAPPPPVQPPPPPSPPVGRARPIIE